MLFGFPSSVSSPYCIQIPTLFSFQASSLAHLSRQNVSIFASVSHADLEGHLPKMGQIDWKILSTNSNRLKEEDRPSKQVTF